MWFSLHIVKRSKVRGPCVDLGTETPMPPHSRYMEFSLQMKCHLLTGYCHSGKILHCLLRRSSFFHSKMIYPRIGDQIEKMKGKQGYRDEDCDKLKISTYFL
jgi:hypothetical protein